MKNLIEDGKTINIVAEKAIEAGELVVLNELVGVAVVGGQLGGLITLQVEGVFELPKAAGKIEQGQRVFVDTSGESPVVKVSASEPTNPDADPAAELSAGIAWEESDGETIAVKINI